jgi:hypothetical protein
MANATTRKIDPSKVATEYAGIIQSYTSPSLTSRVGGACGAVWARGDTLPELIADAFRRATFYLGIGYRVRLEQLTLQCRACHGHGDVALRHKGGVWTRKPCKVCKGQGAFVTPA